MNKPCPICNKEFQPTDAFCPECGYEIHIWPKENKVVDEFEKARAERYKETWEALNKSKVIQQELVEKQKELDESIKGLSDELSSAYIDISRLKAQLKEKQSELADKTAALANLLSEAQHEIDLLNAQLKEEQESVLQHQNTIQELKERISDYSNLKKEKEEWKSKYEELFKEMSEAQLEIERLKTELKNNHNSKLLGIVSIKNRVTNVLSNLPVFKGVNTYGTDGEDGKNHHQIKMRVRGDILKPKMFTVQIDNNKAIVYPIDGICIMCDGLPVPKKGKLVSAQQSLFIGDVLEIHISKS